MYLQLVYLVVVNIFDDADGGRRGATTKVWHDNERANQDGSMPRTTMLQHMIEHDIHSQ